MNVPVTGIALAVVIVGLALSTFVTRTSLLLAGARLRLGHRVEVALRYAPVCTLSAIIVPDVLMHGSSVLDLSPLNPRLIGVAAAALWLCFSRNILGCLTSGMLAYSLARVFL
ncbi:MAG TPA: AzlD domain-containing protein [Steroidobacteraceae bacterium]|jgi:branched-subunit amino acid transport protein|nr:AzlD domain-containing protein [Steroidobacteraceae bacterium]